MSRESIVVSEVLPISMHICVYFERESVKITKNARGGSDNESGLTIEEIYHEKAYVLVWTGKLAVSYNVLHDS